MVKIEIEYTGSLHSEALHTQSGTRLQTDAPLDNGGKGESFSPTVLVATALGTCMTTTMDIFAKRNGFSIDGTRASPTLYRFCTEADVDIIDICTPVIKHMVSQPARRIGKLQVVIEVPLPPDHPQRAILEKVALNCPVQKSLNPDLEIPVSFSWRDDL